MRWIYLIALLGCAPLGLSAEDDDDLKEAVGLDAQGAQTTQAQATEDSLPFRYRGYGLIQYRFVTPSDGSPERHFFPDGELSATVDANLTNSFQAFIDGRAIHDEELGQNRGLLEQGGLRWRPNERVVIAVGKERNRRSPGLLVSPSDFINTDENLPGLRQARSGVWLVRASYQEQAQSYDLFLLPVSKVADNGMPDKAASYRGTAVRLSHQLGSIDTGLMVGRADNGWKAGASAQGFVAAGFKLYGEAGWAETADLGPLTRHSVGRYLVGMSYEGSDIFSARGEMYYNGVGLAQDEFDEAKQRIAANPAERAYLAAVGASQGFFPRRLYGVGTVAFPEIRNRFNVTETVIKSLEDHSYIALSRFEWLASDAQVLGLSLFNFSHYTNDQYAFRPFNWQLVADWRYNV